MQVGGREVLAFRLAGQGLAARAADPPAVLSGWAVQDSPPGAAAAALAARCGDLPPGWLDDALTGDRSAVALYNPRTATAVVPAGEAAAYGAAMLPDDDAGLRAMCPGCKSHHARRGLLVMASLRGRLCVAGRAGRQPAFARTDQWAAWDPPDRAAPGAELVRRYLAGYGPSTPAHLAQWAGIGTAHARALWALVGEELAEVRVDGTARAWVLARDVPLLRDPPPAPGLRLLAPGDPLLLGRDRESLLPDAGLRRRVWAATGGAGVVVADGAPVALWRARKQGARLTVAVEAFGPVPGDALEAEARRLAPHRGCATAEVVLGA